MKKENYTVYMHICPNDKKYIGITKQKPEYRWNDGEGYKGQIFYRAIKKYNWKNIKHKILYTNLSKEEAEQKEVELIKKFESHCTKYGYNVLDDINKHKTERNLRKKVKKVKMKESTKEKLRQINLGKHLSYNSKQKLSKLRKGKPNLKNMKKIICIETGIIYDGITIAYKETNIKISNIQSACSGKSKTAGSYHWQYYKKEGEE